MSDTEGEAGRADQPGEDVDDDIIKPDEECEVGGCTGARLGTSLCVAHASDVEVGEAVNRWLAGAALDARGTRIDSDILRTLIKALEDVEVAATADPPTRVRQSMPGTLRFNGAVFLTDADFSELHLPGEVLFDGATFEQTASFNHTTFRDHADFDNVQFLGEANFRDAKFCGYAGFANARFERAAKFPAAVFADYLDLEHAYFAQDLDIEGAKFESARQLGPVTVEGGLRLESSEFSARVTIDATTTEVLAQATLFRNGVRLSLTGGTVNLERADMGTASALIGGRADQPPQLLGLEGAQVAGVTLSGVDLKRCRFYGAHGLESMNIEPNCFWARPKENTWCIDRDMIAEEKQWRTKAKRRRGVHLGRAGDGDEAAPESATDATDETILQPMQLAALYRALRKAREDSNDQAGAGDLYYGEMEMRRHAPMLWGPGKLRIAAEKSLIGTYWLVAGYGLRASRSLMVLAATILIASGALTKWGFYHSEGYVHAVLFAAQSSVTLLRPPEGKLNSLGEAIEIVVRVAGPALVGLTILALRSRIKR